MTPEFINYLGFLGTILVAVAYVPQIGHLIKERCAYGISLKAWSLWVFAGFLMLPSALLNQASVFIWLLAVQIIAGLFILIFTYFHKGPVCQIHKIL